MCASGEPAAAEQVGAIRRIDVRTIGPRVFSSAASTATCMPLVRIRGTRGFMSVSTRPERLSAALTASADPTMMTISSLKPWKASAGLTMLHAMDASSGSRATRSYRIRPQIRTPIVPRMMAKANA